MKHRDIDHLHQIAAWSRFWDALFFSAVCHARAAWIRGWGR